jgi:3-hydroxyisobutyrate dehydrogenase-like beta-hydroxyacid dehydrogenase
MLFDSGLTDRLPKTSIHVSCTTLGVDTARKLTAEHNKRGRGFVAAPSRAAPLTRKGPSPCR